MKYTLNIESPDFAFLLKSLRSSAVNLAVQASRAKVLYGATSVHHRKAVADVARTDRLVKLLEEAATQAIPERAVQRTDIVARNFTDDMPFVYGKPRNDPRTPSRKLR